MKSMFKYSLFLFLILHNATHCWWEWPYKKTSCQASCQNYCDNASPLNCGAWDVQIQAGVIPIIWRHHDPISSSTFTFPVPGSPLLQLFDGPKFSKLFRIPWTVGGQIGYAVSDHVRLYGEGNYAQASSKDEALITTVTTPALPVFITAHKFKLFEGYIGARYYWDRWCRVAFFLGAKLGLIHHFNTTASLSIVTAGVTLNPAPFLNHNTRISGGLDTGLDICFCGNWAFVLSAQALISGGPHSNENIAITPFGSFTTVSFGNISTEARFPITVGIRYIF